MCMKLIYILVLLFIHPYIPSLQSQHTINVGSSCLPSPLATMYPFCTLAILSILMLVVTVNCLPSLVVNVSLSTLSACCQYLPALSSCTVDYRYTVDVGKIMLLVTLL
ncbi:hypothetical protein L208DRAFT_1375356 [Tricholoma matsutake]|nr:hypothetical protein L208DRAFT_1375356 [Tricholoma matsutake 945]